MRRQRAVALIFGRKNKMDILRFRQREAPHIPGIIRRDFTDVGTAEHMRGRSREELWNLRPFRRLGLCHPVRSDLHEDRRPVVCGVGALKARGFHPFARNMARRGGHCHGKTVILRGWRGRKGPAWLRRIFHLGAAGQAIHVRNRPKQDRSVLCGLVVKPRPDITCSCSRRGRHDLRVGSRNRNHMRQEAIFFELIERRCRVFAFPLRGSQNAQPLSRAMRFL